MSGTLLLVRARLADSDPMRLPALSSLAVSRLGDIGPPGQRPAHQPVVTASTKLTCCESPPR